jgi:hypothetical protein
MSKKPTPRHRTPFPAEIEAATGALAGTIFPVVGSKIQFAREIPRIK